jgi:hypothetical protein
MCKPTIVTLFLLFIVIATTAQESSPKKEASKKSIINRFELVGGPSWSSNTGYLGDYESKVGGSLGVGYYQEIYKSFSLNVRALHELKGSAANYPVGISNGTSDYYANYKFTTKFSYLTFYLMPTLQLGRNKNIYIGAGGTIVFIHKLSVNRKLTNTDTGELIEEDTSNDVHYFDPYFDAGVTFQLGYSFKLSNKCQMMIQGFANRGLVDIHSDWFGSQRNNTYGILLSVRMR